MPDDEVIDQEIEHPVEYEVSTSAGCVTEKLFRHDFAERGIEEIYYFGDYLRELVHSNYFCGCKITTKV